MGKKKTSKKEGADCNKGPTYEQLREKNEDLEAKLVSMEAARDMWQQKYDDQVLFTAEQLLGMAKEKFELEVELRKYGLKK